MRTSLAALAGAAAIACAGTAGPVVEVSALSDTREPLGPYPVHARATDDGRVVLVALGVEINGQGVPEVRMTERDGVWSAEIRPLGGPFAPGTTVRYWARAVDDEDNSAKSEVREFRILPPE